MCTVLLQHGGKGKWEKAHERLVGQLKKKWKSTGNITLTEHMLPFEKLLQGLFVHVNIQTILHQLKENKYY